MPVPAPQAVPRSMDMDADIVEETATANQTPRMEGVALANQPSPTVFSEMMLAVITVNGIMEIQMGTEDQV